MPSPWVPAGSGGGLVDSVSGAAPVTSTGGTDPVVGIGAASGAARGTMSAADFSKLAGLTPGAAVASVSGTAPIASSGGTTPAISINPAVASVSAGSLSAADKAKLDGIVAGAGSAGLFLIGAASMWPSITSGAAGLSQVEYVTNKVNTFVMDFLTAVKTYCEVDVELPLAYNGGTMTAVFYWLANSASANSVVWGLQGRSYADASAIDQAFGAAVEVTDANTGTNLINISATSVVMTLAGAPAGGQHAQFRLYRLGSGADNLAATGRLLGVRITFGQS